MNDTDEYEVKKLLGRKWLIFTSKQLKSFAQTNPTVLIYGNGPEPVEVKPFLEVLKSYKIYSPLDDTPNITVKSNLIPELIKIEGELTIMDGKRRNHNDAIQFLIREHREAKIGCSL